MGACLSSWRCGAGYYLGEMGWSASLGLSALPRLGTCQVSASDERKELFYYECLLFNFKCKGINEQRKMTVNINQAERFQYCQAKRVVKDKYSQTMGTIRHKLFTFRLKQRRALPPSTIFTSPSKQVSTWNGPMVRQEKKQALGVSRSTCITRAIKYQQPGGEMSWYILSQATILQNGSRSAQKLQLP